MYRCNKVTDKHAIFMRAKLVSIYRHIMERNRNFGLYKCENFQARSHMTIFSMLMFVGIL